ncbi:MAG: DUF1343 domain-containing protein [Ignavibacteria bacterium]|nr:DUF1343 domain-containing protein [Ignavibacteria bacterium]NCS82471.1 DUF1343 domain-containing protein [Ignavibacteria bacterium]OIO18172.1 MAG: hypothetical protein AUJ54_08665 [Ignavibacteria bacterium CG1_02_37_35]PIS44796.1 MAG: DUF1343 domain-containing protein [Ignavibacteria bacterium CG08_land_8_20_14_0_20_37_9]PJC59942.1 MAG: DUF1343 domain-containing protein [Ignavibacteria bacterium CG_4_9_14_0_2_um_filter_37_13]
MKKSKFVLFISLLLFSSQFLLSQLQVKLGIDVLQERGFDVLKGKRIGLITNPTGVDKKLKSTIDILFESKECKLTALYGPEHGVRGDFSAGTEVDFYVDPKTHLPVYSLYGKTRKPSKEMLSNIELLVYDIQDIGCRSYTFISTLGLAMEAAAENNIPFVVLDRPNPLGGIKIEGNLVEDGFYSFVSQYKIPYVHGLTLGEFANLINGEGMLKDKIKCDLTVIPMRGWKREMNFAATGLEWIPTSPHIPYKETPEYYVATGILGELGFISEGVGYTIPFQTFAAEWIDGELLAQKMNALNLEGIIFRPITFKPFYGKHKDSTLHGVQLHIKDYAKVNLMSMQFLFLEVHNEMYPEKNPFKLGKTSRFGMFDKVCGTSKIRELFSKRLKYEDIQSFLLKDVPTFRKLSEKYYLYSE